MQNSIRLSSLGHTWILDLDGTIVKHNGYKVDGKDTFLVGAKEFLKSISEKDFIVFLTSRTEEHRADTEAFLDENGVRYDHIIFGAPYGERVLINDDKPSGLHMSIGINKKRDEPLMVDVIIDEKL